MAKRLSRASVENTVNQLVEALHDQDASRTELENFKATNPAPEPPPAFEYLSEFLDHHESTQRYQVELERREKALATADKLYAKAADSLQDVLPEGIPLRFDYLGMRRDLYGKRYGIVKEQGEVSVYAIEDTTDQNG
jgi:hypothetical protein